MRRKTVQIILPIFILLFTVLIFGYALIQADEIQLGRAATAVGSAFTYQGRLNDGGTAATGNYDFQFALYDDVAAGSQVGSTINQTLAVSDGLFTTSLDFGDGVFDGGPRFLDIAVKLSGGGGYTSLTPRQAINAAPYASYADKVQPLANVVNVAKSGGDFTSVNGAVASITDATVDNPYVVRIAPGVYTETVDLKAYVDLEGSGEGVTIIRGFGSNTGAGTDGSSATLRVDSITAPEVRFLTAESDGNGKAHATAIWVKSTSISLELTHVNVLVSNGETNTGIYIYDSSPTMEAIKIKTSNGTTNYGIQNRLSSPTMHNVNIQAQDGTGNNFGIYNFDGAPTMNSVFSKAIGGTNTYGISNENNSSPIMHNVESIGTNGSNINRGIYNNNAHPVLYNVTVQSSAFLANSIGIKNEGDTTLKIYNSKIAGKNNSVFNGGDSSTMIANTQLNGIVAVGGGLTCVGAYDDTFAALNATCQ